VFSKATIYLAAVMIVSHFAHRYNRSEYNILHDGVFAVRIVASALNCKPATELITISVGPQIIVTPYPVPFSISVATRDVVKQIARSEQAQPRLAIIER
jgi:hypothetical protein